MNALRARGVHRGEGEAGGGAGRGARARGGRVGVCLPRGAAGQRRAIASVVVGPTERDRMSHSFLNAAPWRQNMSTTSENN